VEVKYWQKALEDLDFWKKSGNKIIQKKISELIIDIEKTPYSGIGKPEQLKYNLAGKWSRRITKEHRLVYQINDDSVEILSLKGHYD
jgi:toxin YoeB